MNNLERLRQHQPDILRAEIVGLLHNIGKLDSNFLASKVKDEDTARQEVAKHRFDISNYRFDRFAAPDIALLRDNIREILSNQGWDSRAALAKELKIQFSDPAEQAAIEALIDDWDEAKKIYQFIARQLEAAWQFNAFKTSNGPLYQCLISHRQEDLQSLELAYQRSQEELAAFDFNAVPPRERQERREALQKAEQEAQSRLQRVRDTIYQKEEKQQQDLETEFRKIKLSVTGESWSVADLLALFWDDFFYQPDGDGYKRQSALAYWLLPTQTTKIPALLILSHGEVSIAEKADVTTENPSWQHLRLASAYGYEKYAIQPWELPQKRHHLLRKALKAYATPAQEREGFIAVAEEILKTGLSDTQWPINEIDLWDYANTITTLFKSSIAKAVFENNLPSVGDMRWQFLSVRYDGLLYLSQAQRVSDLLARRDALNQALDAIQVVVEVELPLGNEIYRDENGSVLVVPHVVSDAQEVDLLKLPTEGDGDADLLERSLANRFATADEQSPLGGELAPAIVLSGPLRGKELRLTEIENWQAPPLASDTKLLTDAWPEAEIRGEVCTVCGVRLQGYGSQDWAKHQREGHKAGERPRECQVCKAQSRAVCQTCEQRRADRSHAWATNARDAASTIWIDEVADINGQVALIVGQFELDDWLSGKLVETMRKPISFPRSRRIWETTKQFWQEIQNETFAARPLTDDRRRILLWLDKIINLGGYHVYEFELDQITMSLVWRPSVNNDTGGYLISADNLGYTARQLGAEREVYEDPATAAIFVEDCIRQQFVEGNTGDKQTLVLRNPEAPGTRRVNLAAGRSITKTQHQDTAYSTAIPILAEPRTFMALVPADQALEVAQAIKTKYEREMGKVRNRLPLHLGVVYAHRRTPLRAILDAGRRMLQQKPLDSDKTWQVQADAVTGAVPEGKEALATGTQQFEQTIPVQLEQDGRSLTWYVPAVMGDGITDDNWYPYVFFHSDKDGNTDPTRAAEKRSRIFKSLRPTANGQAEECWLVHAGELKAGDQVYFTPATLDFEWLDTAARRFEIAYDTETGKRLGRLTRPHLLDDLDSIQQAWCFIKEGLTSSQIYTLRDLVEAKREAWFDRSTQSLTQLCRDAVANAEWKKPLSNEQKEQVARWLVSGLFADVVELYMGIMKAKPQRDEEREKL